MQSNDRDSIFARIAPFCLVGGIYAASCTSNLAAPKIDLLFAPDKVFHYLVFGLLATSIIRLRYFRTRGWRGQVYTALIVSIYAILDEYRQSLTPGRFVEFNDWLADTLGAITAVIVYHKLKWYHQLLEWSVFKKSKKSASQAKQAPS